MKRPPVKKTKCLDCGEVEVVKYLSKKGIYEGKSLCKLCSNKNKRKYYGLA